jgi:beta-phosphoglucomutase-like phosphatase (HAD superfamily)
VRTGAISASANTLPMLHLAGLASLIETWVDADVIDAEGARTPPAPDLLLAACRRLGVPPHLAVSFTHRPAGVAAGRAAGMRVIGVGIGAEEDVLRGFGADVVVPSLAALLDRVILDGTQRPPGGDFAH